MPTALAIAAVPPVFDVSRTDPQALLRRKSTAVLPLAACDLRDATRLITNSATTTRS